MNNDQKKEPTIPSDNTILADSPQGKTFRRAIVFRSFVAAFAGVVLTGALGQIMGSNALWVGPILTGLMFWTFDETIHLVFRWVTKRLNKNDTNNDGGNK